jgi:hypothetical protein
VRLEPKNIEAQAMLKKIQDKYNEILFEQNRLEGNRLLGSGNCVEALEYYEKCLRITRKATTYNNISVLVNKTQCLLKLE